MSISIGIHARGMNAQAWGGMVAPRTYRVGLT